ncbi:MAG TPA: sigma-54 dependent transcriptional regulator, partial [Terracidiphilus sp.]|nr:sigma-54 dependent transcriptional regulator [Terracidiphilus sp.]
GQSPAIGKVRDFIARVAKTSTTVLITGETGTGKELVARAIHRNSLRAKKPFIAINCAAVTETLLESELFGHERGAFTGADRARAGLFEAAHEGTLFLDEVAEMSLAAQAKLLRVLADGEIQRVGSTATRRVDVRVLAATHRRLENRVREGVFREDLYYRLAVVPVHIAPLRERPEDISELSRSLARRIAAEMKIAARPVSTAALEKLSGYSFPGNVRELENLLERALILGQGSELQPEDFPLQPASTNAPLPAEEVTPEALASRLPKHVDLRKTITEIERALIVRSLHLANGVQAEAARYLGVSRSDLGYKIGKYGLLGSQDEKEAIEISK